MKRVAAVLVAVLLLAAIPVFGQMTGARLSGTVKDPTGAVVTEAKVIIRNQATGITQTTTTGNTGLYIFRGLQPGTYDIIVERNGFQTKEAKGLTLRIGQDMGYDFALQVGAVAEKVDVKAETPLVEVNKSQVDTVITSEQLDHMPVDGRFFLDLLYNSTPGVAGNNGGLGDGPSVNGQLGFANQYTIDGVTNTNSTLQSVRARINMDSIQEFQILTHQFEAQFGNANGAIVNVATKGGTNAYHGSSYTFIRDAAFDAQAPYQKYMDKVALQMDPNALIVKPDNYRRIFGGTFGGPIKQSKAFFFGSYEYSKEIDVHKVMAPEEYNLGIPLGPTSGVWSGRIDYTPSERDSLLFRYNGQRSNGTWGPGGWNTKSTEYNEIFQPHSWGASWTRAISARTVSELRAQFAMTLDSASSDQNLPFSYTIYRPHSVVGKFQNMPWDTPEYNGQLVYNLSMTRGRHDIKIGGSYMRVVSDGANRNLADGAYEFAFDSNDPLHGTYNPADPFSYPWHYIQRLGKDDWHIPDNVIGAFAQDKWSIRDNLVLTLGVRYDYEDAFSSVPGSGTVTGRPIDPIKTNISPRLAIAYSPFGPKTVIRAGFGRFFGRIPLNEAALVIQNTVNAVDQKFLEDVWWWRWHGDPNNVPGCCWPQGPGAWIPDGHQVSYPVPPPLDSFYWRSSSIDVLDANLKTPYTDHYTVGLQQQLTKTLALNVDFVRILGKNLWVMVDRNAPNPTTGVRPDANFERIMAQSSLGHSWYSAMEVTLKHNGRKDSFTLTYTRAKAVDDVRGDPNNFGAATTCSFLVNQDPGAIRCDRGLSINDLPHRITFDGSYKLPFKFIASGSFDWHSGYPWTMSSGLDLNGDAIVDYAPGYGRDTKRNDDWIWSQMRFGREFVFKDRYTWEPVTELFNTTNPASYVGIDGNIRNQGTGDPTRDTFGLPTGSGSGRRLQFGFRFAF